uniref:Uncharacterized protein n=1 Tax=Amphilophus citrinellus TaxID=61819 RepID=A0A3Q0R7N7_AMPCI
MAAKNSSPYEDITCPQCTDIYCLPVLLKCGHNICRVCLFKFWEWKGLRECPVCGHVSDTGRPPINLALHNVVKEHKVLIMTKNRDKFPVVLDPNTAHANLKFSQELTCVHYDSKQFLPDNLERLTNRVSVLGANGFTSGKHRWTVDVGQGKDWYIGVALESIQRKNTIFLSPAEGVWVIGLSNGDSLWAQTTTRSKLPIKEKPQRITVELDYEKGKVTFINAVDSTKIYSFKDRFSERIFPYFAPGLCEDTKNSSMLTICPQIIKVEVE